MGAVPFRVLREIMRCFRLNELLVIGYPCLRKLKNSGIVRGQTLLVARRKCTAKSCFEVQENGF